MKWLFSFINFLSLVFAATRTFVNLLFNQKLIEFLLLVLGILVAGIIIFSSFSGNSLHLNNKFNKRIGEINLITLFEEKARTSSTFSQKSDAQLPDLLWETLLQLSLKIEHK